MEVVTTEQMQACERWASDYLGMPTLLMMENAGAAVASLVVEEIFAHDDEGLSAAPMVIIFCGPGNNGGDGISLARHLTMAKIDPLVVLAGIGVEELKGDAAIQGGIWQKMGGQILSIKQSSDLKKLPTALAEHLLLVDAIFGTGLNRPLSPLLAEVVDWINGEEAYVLSIDLPSGLHADSGQVLSKAVEADLTVALAYPKIGMFTADGPRLCGALEVVDIGIPKFENRPAMSSHPLAHERHLPNVIESDFVAPLFAPRPNVSHKGDFGHVLLIAGSQQKSGAAVLAAKASQRAGAGLVTLAVPSSSHLLIKPQLVEVMSAMLPEEDHKVGISAWADILQLAKNKSVVAIGPGLEQSTTLAQLLCAVVKEIAVPLVIDADGLNALAEAIELNISPFASRKTGDGAVVLTPHPGEMARLCGKSSDFVQKNRVEVARDFALEHGIILVLKGYRTVIALPTGEIAINPTGNPAMATAGMGDVLTGMIAAYIAQGFAPEKAVMAAVFNHGLCGDRLAERRGDRGVIASDLIEEIPLLHAEIVSLAGDDDRSILAHPPHKDYLI